MGGAGSKGALSFRGLGDIADRLPPDMLFVMRTMHLVADLHKNLGGQPAGRFKTYVQAAAVGAWAEGCHSQSSPLRRHAWWRSACAWFAGMSIVARLALHELWLGVSTRRQEARLEHFSLARTLAESMDASGGGGE